MQKPRALPFLLALLLLASCVPYFPQHVHWTTGPPNLYLSMEQARLIVVARVEEVGEDRWSTPGGQISFVQPHTYDIFRPVVLDVERALPLAEGVEDPGERLVVARRGGEHAGIIRSYWDGYQEFEAGQRVVVVLKPWDQALRAPQAALPYWTVVARFLVEEGVVDYNFGEAPLDEFLAMLLELPQQQEEEP